MSKPPGRWPSLLLVAASAALLLPAAGCKDNFSDAAFGVLDLSSTYDGGTTNDPARGLPSQIAPTLGFVDGNQAEYYDFGVVPVQSDTMSGKPIAVVVQPMYFFFTPEGYPLFSAPVRETRDGTDWMRGGAGVVNPNPKDFCAGVMGDQAACKARNASERKLPYSLRARDPLVDPLRKNNDYQRPLVDQSPADRNSLRPYTGFWEVYEVTVPAGYVPDAIKHVSTLRSALDSGSFKARSTQKVINCPIVDERTIVPQGITDRPTPRPRIELWYKRQLAFCYLVNGWETLGNDQGQLFFSNSDDQRVDTFEVNRITVGEGAVRENRLVIPIDTAYTPAIFTSDQGVADPSVTRISGNLLTRGLPRHHRNDPGGYTPVRWLWDLPVDTMYLSGGLTSVDAVDASITQPWNAFASPFVPVVHNVPLRGLASKCSLPEVPGRTPKVCGKEVPNPDDPVNPLVVATGDPVCTSQGLECNKDTCFCDAPFVGYGQTCGPGIAQCSPQKDSLSDNGYGCFPAFGGFCYLACNPAAMNTRAMENQGRQPAQFVDTRCKELPGYVCLGYNGGGLCLKLCDQNVTDLNQCASSAAASDGTPVDLGGSQVCQDFGIEVCTWPDTYTPS